ncbi:hypothetical protein H5410_028451 [Solanum commersonii]|uniref:MADS-box domain-containing protein n=1 Tax=Solanum commersonii TaxID=4109 RepID=A0A9J5Z4Z7_SOLCO|nr:hypothetical protein H5410_028451 [Solanum commersonii]
MTRNKVNYDFIEDDSKRKILYNKRLKGLLKKSDELKTLCDVEVATVIYGPYRNEPYTFPNNDVVRNTFIKFKELPTLDRFKNMVTREEFSMQRIKKLEEQLQKIRKENRVKEMTNEMYEVFERKTVFVDMNPLPISTTYVVYARRISNHWNNSEGSMDPSPLLFSLMFPPMVPQFFSPMPQHMAVGETPGLTHSMPSTIMCSPIPSPMMDSLIPSPMIDSPMPSLMIAPPMYFPVSPTMNQQMELSMDILSIGISTSMNNNQNSSVDLPDSPTISRFLKWKDDVVMTLLDDPFFKNINVQYPNQIKKI